MKNSVAKNSFCFGVSPYKTAPKCSREGGPVTESSSSIELLDCRIHCLIKCPFNLSVYLKK